jgi:protein TonB
VPDQMFREIVDPYASRGSRKYTVILSLAAHAAGIAATIVVPLVAIDGEFLPAPSTMISFVTDRPLPPPPPAPAPRADIERRQSETLEPQAPPIPIEAPATITPDPPAPHRGEPLIGVEAATGLIRGDDSLSALAPPPAIAVPPPPMRPGVGIKAPVKVKDVAPVYPRLAQVSRVEGTVIIEATIGPGGRVQDAKVLRSIPLLDGAALDAVRQWEYQPTLFNGVPVAVIMTVTVHFTLR